MKENLYTKDCIRTFTGKYFNIAHPNKDLICIEDIAHALSQLPRFGGHLPRFYSVAEHCLNAVTLTVIDPKNKLAALLHDASEAYLLDLPSPIKHLLKDYYAFEHNIMATIALKYGFKYPLCEEVKDVDKFMLEMEWESIMLGNIFNYHLEPQDPLKIEKMFIEKFNELISISI